MYFSIDKVNQYRDGVIGLMNSILGWDEETRSRYEAELDRSYLEATRPAMEK